MGKSIIPEGWVEVEHCSSNEGLLLLWKETFVYFFIGWVLVTEQNMKYWYSEISRVDHRLSSYCLSVPDTVICRFPAGSGRINTFWKERKTLNVFHVSFHFNKGFNKMWVIGKQFALLHCILSRYSLYHLQTENVVSYSFT